MLTCLLVLWKNDILILHLITLVLGTKVHVDTASCSPGDLECFVNYVKNLNSALSETSVSFLDILVYINGNRSLITSVFYKPTDSHSYLLYSSSHTNHTKKSVPFSEFLRLSRLYNEDEDFQFKSLKMKEFFVQRGYPISLLDTSQIPPS